MKIMEMSSGFQPRSLRNDLASSSAIADSRDPQLSETRLHAASSPAEGKRERAATTEEAARLEALRRYRVLDTPPEESFDRLARLAARFLEVPIAAVSLVDAARQWPKACFGIDMEAADRDVSFCAYAIERPGEVMVVEDARQDPRFAEAPFVTGAPGIRFYAGAPLVTPDGHALGTLCVFDREPRETPPAEDLAVLEDLADTAVDELELRREAAASQRAREELRESEARHRALVERASDIMTILGPRGRVRYESPSVRRVLGRNFGSIVGKNIFGPEGIHPEDRETVLEVMRRGLERPGDVQTVQYRMKHAKGHWVDLESVVRNLLGDETVGGFIANTRDVTDSLRYEAEREARERAEELLATKTALLNNVSHELRTPLASILGFAGVIKDESSQGTVHEEFAAQIARSGQRLQRTLDSVLSLAELGEGPGRSAELETVDVARAAREAVESIQPQVAEKEIDLRLDVPEEGPEATGARPLARADESALQRVLDNLLSNAVKFTVAGGRVTVRVATRSGEAQEGDEVRLEVEDTGVGMSEAFRREKLFEEFEQESTGLTREHEGTGLGMAITQRLVESMGGTIEVASEEGEGTVFTVCLPAATTAEASESA